MRRHPGLGLVSALAVAAVAPAPGAAQLVGSVATQSRLFFGKPLSVTQPRWHDLSVAAEATYERRLGPVVLSAEGFWRLAEEGTERGHAEAREALLRIAGDDVAADLGIHTVFWGVTESRHLVDVVNQKDYLEDFDGEDKLGQLMALLTVDVGRRGFVELLAMTWFRPLRFPSGGGRPGALVPVLDDRPVYEDDRERWSPDLAARWSHSIAAFDWALSYFHGTSREPQLIAAGAPGSSAL
ncbi:MAG TPA: hypothetical protein VLA09_09470, partial [Longimicrobiales bacterium]|nr:hypothetical protein [Longimicrobiales bacterium]